MDRLPFTVGEVAESLALSRSTLYRLIASGELLGADCPMTDQEIKAMLDQFRQIAFIALDTVEAERHRSTPTTEGSDS
jgi:hypothetical protein